MKKLSLFSYLIAGFFFIAAFEAFRNREYQPMFIYLVIGFAFILVKMFKRKNV